MGSQKLKILVTGDQGFLGKHLVDRLTKDGHEIYGYDLKSSLIFPDHPVDLVYHLAANVNAFASVADPYQGLQNVETLFTVLEWMRQSGSRKIIFASSREVYSLQNAYGASKMACEAFLTSYCHSYDFAAISCRLANIYGEGNLPFRFMGSTVESARRNEDIIVYGGKDKVLNFIHVSDVVDNLVKEQIHLATGMNKVAEIAYPKSYRLTDLAAKIIQMTGSKSKIIRRKNRKGETLQYFPHQWVECKVSISKGLEECLAS